MEFSLDFERNILFEFIQPLFPGSVWARLGHFEQPRPETGRIFSGSIEIGQKEADFVGLSMGSKAETSKW